MIIDALTSFTKGVCQFCKEQRYVCVVWDSSLTANEPKKKMACRTCIRLKCKKEDFKLFSVLWFVSERVCARQRCLDELDELVKKQPANRFIKIIREITIATNTHKQLTQAVHRMYLGLRPTPSQFKHLTKLIKDIRHVRIHGSKPRYFTVETQAVVGAKLAVFYSGTGSNRFF